MSTLNEYTQWFIALSVLCPSSRGFDATVDAHARIAREFSSFQLNYLFVYFLITAGDWLQGPYLYALYKSYEFSLTQIATLYVTGFVSSGLIGTFIGSAADK
ncbi:6898_t:CDS:2 [Paraglomus occultum]|uniref:6898_t:CDS:1 n=1 Tax=Paraglomus occultum TaxID=144539 RepID=A0A9N9CRX5_9GLOM|nr:6898_t:CDS:2 [Paraglomus occultum]